MLHVRVLMLGIACLITAAQSTVVMAQVTPAQNKLLARRAAEADCYRKLAETVYGVQLNSETYVRDFVTESDQIKTSVDAFIKGIKLGQPTYYEDGACEVPGEVAVEKVIQTLKEVHAAHYKGNKVTTTDIVSIKESIKRDVFTATGMGSPRPDLPPDLPAGTEQLITQIPQDYAPPTVKAVPGIWKTITPQARLMARRAAELDAQRKLLERIKGLRLTSNTLVRDFVTEYDEISTQASGIVVGARTVQEYYFEDDLIVEVTMEIPVERVVQKLQELHSQYYKGNKVITTDIVKIKETIERDVILATGSGTPPAKFVQEASAKMEIVPPAWAPEPVCMVGEGTSPDITSPQGRLMAGRAAELDALRKLGEHLQGLQIDSATTVRDFVTMNDEINARFFGIIRGARSDPAEFRDGVASVRACLPGSEVWSIISEYKRIEIRHKGQ